RVVLLGAGSISQGQRQRHSVPLPPALATTTEWRRLTVTLSWLSPINPRSQVHRMARLLFQPQEDRLDLGRTEADHNAARRGTVQHEVLEGTDAVAFAAGSVLAIDVDCRVDAGKLDTPIRYGIAASLEMATTVQADIHAQVRQGLQVQLRQQVTPRS
ncbi:MAG: peptidase S8, partial [Actinobacteria bacterium]|nr:peptidase S8 [Actinomycetota bacterium]